MKKVYIIKAEKVTGDWGRYDGEETLRTIYATKDEMHAVVREEIEKITARGAWWMDHARNAVNREIPNIIVETLEVEGL